MAKKPDEPARVPRQMIAYRIHGEIYARLVRFCENHVPRVSNTQIVEAAITEYLDRHEPKAKKGER